MLRDIPRGSQGTFTAISCSIGFYRILRKAGAVNFSWLMEGPQAQTVVSRNNDASKDYYHGWLGSTDGTKRGSGTQWNSLFSLTYLTKGLHDPSPQRKEVCEILTYARWSFNSCFYFFKTLFNFAKVTYFVCVCLYTCVCVRVCLRISEKAWWPEDSFQESVLTSHIIEVECLSFLRLGFPV